MARTGDIVTVNPATVTQLTNADVGGNLTFMHTSGGDAYLYGTTDATAPSASDFDGGLIYRFREGERAVTLADLFPGASYVRLWAYSPIGANFTIWHA